jgi:hypothetical protein
MNISTARGQLGTLPAGIWTQGRTKFAYVDIGNERLDDCWVVDYLLGSLENQVGYEVELSFCRLDKHSVHLCAIKKADGRIERMPDLSPVLLRETIVTSLIWGLITFISSWFIAPFALVPLLFALNKVMPNLSEKFLAPMMFFGFFCIWAAQLVWVVFYSKKLSPRVRSRALMAARTALD